MKLCKNCQEPFEEKDYRSVFCSRSCSATYTNKHFPKRKRLRICKTCTNLVSSGYTYCKDCIKLNKHMIYGKPLMSMTLEEFETRSGQKNNNRYSGIRFHSRMIARELPNICKCGYDKHVEVCHIKGISEFPKTTLVSVINAKENLIKLCPNCHWEFDNL